MRYSMLRPIALLLARSEKYRLQWTGEDNAPRHGPLIVVANHQSSVDPIAVALALHKTARHEAIIPWGKVEIAQGLEGPLGFILWRIFKVIPIDREVEGEMSKAIRASLDYLRKGNLIMVFPEGSRFPPGEVGPFHYGVANLARSAPAPILPVACWRRAEDHGLQVNIGKPFFMPDISRPLKVLTELEEKAEDRIGRRIDVLKEWSAGVSRDRKGMKLIANTIGMVLNNIEKQEFNFDSFCRLAESEDNKFLQDKILELLPAGWRRVNEKEGIFEVQRYQDKKKRKKADAEREEARAAPAGAPESDGGEE